jgi:hypothetical protein
VGYTATQPKGWQTVVRSAIVGCVIWRRMAGKVGALSIQDNGIIMRRNRRFFLLRLLFYGDDKVLLKM